MRFVVTNPLDPTLALGDRLVMDNTFALYMGGKWVEEPVLETVSLRQTVNSVPIDVYVRVM